MFTQSVLFIECWFFVLLAVVLFACVNLSVLETDGDDVSECIFNLTAMFNITIVNKHIKPRFVESTKYYTIIITMLIMYEH
mgnify:CR=1 FL=1